MSDAESLVEALRYHLQAMYHGTEASERRRSDRWLQKLQRDSAGWGLADAILGGRTVLVPADELRTQASCEALLFAAMTLHVKVCGDLHELPETQRVNLREAALEHLSRWGCGPGAASAPPAVVKKLALAVAALAVQTSWDGVFAYVERQLALPRPEGATAVDLAASVDAVCRTKRVAVELLTALPEQCAARRLSVNRARREGYAAFLRSASSSAVAVVTSVVGATQEATHLLVERRDAELSGAAAAGSPGGDSTPTQSQSAAAARHATDFALDCATRLNSSALGCLQSWLCWSDVDPGMLTNNPLFLGAFDALGHADLGDVAADVVVEALRRYDCTNPDHQAIVATVAPRVMGLRPLFEAATARGDEDDAMGLCRIFCEMGEAYMPLIASPLDANQLAIVDLELLCARHPARRVATLPLRFFYKLSRAVRQMPDDLDGSASGLSSQGAPQSQSAANAANNTAANHHHQQSTQNGQNHTGPPASPHRTTSSSSSEHTNTPRGGANDDGTARLLQALVEPFLGLTRACVIQAKRTDDDGTLDEFARDEYGLGDDFSRHRGDLADALGDCAFFLGPDAVLEIIGDELQRACSSVTTTTTTTTGVSSSSGSTSRAGGAPPLSPGTAGATAAAAADAAQDGVEACFFALRAVANWVPDTESRVLPAAFRLLTTSIDPSWRPALRAGIAAISAYNTWLHGHTADLLEPVVGLLVTQLETAASRLRARDEAALASRGGGSQPSRASRDHRRLPSGPSAAAKALKAVCSSCRLELARLRALDLRDRLVDAGVSLRDELEVLEGLGHVVCAHDDFDALCAGFERLVAPPALSLANLSGVGGGGHHHHHNGGGELGGGNGGAGVVLNGDYSSSGGSPSGGGGPSSAPRTTTPTAKAVVAELERLTSIVRCTTPPKHHLDENPGRRHPVLALVERLWPVFEAIAETHGDAPHLIERLCRCYKHAMRSCRHFFEPMLTSMITHLVRHFARSPLSSYVYASSICITEFGRDPSKEQILFDMFNSLSSTVFTLFQSLDDFRHRPDVAEEYFYLASRFLDYCPDTLVHSPLLASVLRCGRVGLALEHREAQRGVLHCFERTVVVAQDAANNAQAAAQAADANNQSSLVASGGGAIGASGSAEKDARRAQALRSLLVDGPNGQAFGRDIAEGVVRALTGDLPAYALDEGHGSLVGVLWRLRLFCPSDLPIWCHAALANVPERFASNDIKQDLLVSIAHEPPRKDAFCDALLVFSARCRDLAKVLR